MSNNNPFAEAFKSWGDFSAPSADYKEVIASSRKNVEAAIAAGQVVAETAQVIARKQAEIARNSTQDIIDLWKEVSSSKSVESGAAKQADFAKEAIEKSLNNSRELFDLASKANTEAYEILNKQAQQAANEVTKAAKKSAA
jgi:phasin family protein